MHVNARLIGVLLGSVLAMGQAPTSGRANAGATVSVRADFSRHTSLRVSSSQVQFDVIDPLTPPATVVDFTAAARTIRGGEVLLTVESAGPVQAPGSGPTAPDVAVVYQGEGGNSGTLSGAGPHVAGRWTSSGVRDGRIWFALRGVRLRGVYTLPVKFVLSTP